VPDGNVLGEHGIDAVGEQRVRVIIMEVMRIIDQARIVESDILIAAGDAQFQIARDLRFQGNHLRYMFVNHSGYFWS